MKLYSHNYYNTNDQGFSLIEMLATVIILGIIAAISAPNLVALFSHHKVNNGMAIINGAIKETQRQAIRQGITCSVVLDTVNRTMTGNPPQCLPEQRDIDDSPQSTDDISIVSNIAPAPATLFTIAFSAKGNTVAGGTIVVFSPRTDTQRCFVIGPGLGITRTGNYTDPLTVPVDTTNLDPTAFCDSN